MSGSSFLAPSQILTIQPPLSRCGQGPALIIVRPSCYATCQQHNDSLDPEPLKKWAEESFTVAQLTLDQSVALRTQDLLNQAVHELVKQGCDGEKVGLIVYGSKTDYASGVEEQLRAAGKVTAAICFDNWDVSVPTLLHLSNATEKKDGQVIYSYADIAGPSFIIPGHSDFKITTAGVAHTRSVGFIKKHLGGPFFDLESIWDEHTLYEFGDRSVEKTMATMVQEPYVNHIPTLTGGIGRSRLSHFYLHHFIFNNPDDTALELISRTVGTDRIVDEFIFVFTHVRQMDWMIPGIPPTGKHLRVPFTSVVNIRGDCLFHEHIAWDQATVLVQLGLLPEYLPFPYALPDGSVPAPGNRFEYRVPAAGVECASKLQNEHAVPSNLMFEYAIREVDPRGL
ncbi:unnamed protein product [Penicillium salamii]|uniref:Carboxymethylenebutenolidase n=1 Tax=Penicillium salamii TaxID=1612424 RepID=A0A9W4K1K3_9EURO|nr:unnamed protein product [Penicillium salamii]CAG8018313.1 unnamed protein product [Penicillium salamii]CAG8125958.1 unnamed protein product [Penicillium salamii]CAG8244413.1 unnamed protein product [Penicillium salamii]CAG8285206.1 unnamed protein product [Penicillium salamii]